MVGTKNLEAEGMETQGTTTASTLGTGRPGRSMNITPDYHYREAEELLAEADRVADMDMGMDDTTRELIAKAHVHAILATCDPSPDR